MFYDLSHNTVQYFIYLIGFDITYISKIIYYFFINEKLTRIQSRFEPDRFSI